MGIQINGNTDNITATDGGLSITSLEINQTGISTFQAGMNVSGGQIDVGSNIKLGNAGVVTATSFVGSGANLTGLPAETTINNRADNRVLTATGSANVLNAESNVHIDGSGRLMVGTTTEGHAEGDDLTIATSGVTGITIRSGTSSAGNIFFSDATSGSAERQGILRYDHADDAMKFNVNNAERLRIDSSGRLLLGTTTEGYSGGDDLTISTSGDTGMTIRSGTSNQGTIAFSDATSGADEYRGYIQYMHNGDALLFGTASTERLRIASNGDFGFNDSSPTAHSSGNNTVLSIKGKGSSYSGKIDFKDSDGNLDSYINSDNSVLQFYADPNSQNGNTLMRFYVHGAERFRFGAAGQFGIGTNYGTAGQVLKSGGASAAPTWGSAGGETTEIYAYISFGSTYDSNSGYVVHNISSLQSGSGITCDTSNERLTPTTAGKYLVIYMCNWLFSFSGGATFYNRVTKNGSEQQRSTFAHYDPGSHTNTTTCVITMNGSSDYVQFEGYENKSGQTAQMGNLSRAVMFKLRD